MTAAIAIYDDYPKISFTPLLAFLVSVIASIAGYFMADDDDSDLEEDYLSDEERAALEDEDEEDGNENDTDKGDDGKDDDESGQGGVQVDEERGDDDVQDGNPDDKEADPDAQTDADTNEGNSSESQGDDPEDDENQDKEKETPAATDGADGSGADPGYVKHEPSYEQKIKDLDQRLDDGKIDFDEYKKELRELEHSRTHEIIRQEIQRSKAEETWQAEQRAFFAANESLSPGKANPIVYNAFAGEVARLASDKAWTSRSGADLLAEAKKNVEAAFGLKSENKDPEPPPKKKEKTDGQKAVDIAKKANANQDGLKTLKDVPAGDKNTDNPFDYLDSLEGAEFESAIAKLSPAEMKAYENSI